MRIQVRCLSALVAVFAVATVAAAERKLPPVVSAPGTTAAAPVTAGASQASLEDRLLRVERVIESGTLVEMLRRLENLQREVQVLRGDIDEQAHIVKGIRDRQRKLYLDIDRRLGQLEQTGPGATRTGAAQLPGGIPQAASPGTAQASRSTQEIAAGGADTAGGARLAAPGTAAQPAAAIDPTMERRAYENAFAKIRDGQYEAAIKDLQAFLAKYPGGQYAGNAQYWLGEANYKNGRYAGAIQEFNKVAEQYPSSPKVPGSLLKIGFAYYETQEWSKARSQLEEVIKRYPNSSAARLAAKRLQKMKLEGR